MLGQSVGDVQDTLIYVHFIVLELVRVQRVVQISNLDVTSPMILGVSYYSLWSDCRRVVMAKDLDCL